MNRCFLPFLLIALVMAGGGCERTPVSSEVIPLTYDQLHAMISSRKSGVTVVNVWASWCAPCNEEIPDFVRLHKKYADDQVMVLLVSVDDSSDVDSLIRPVLSSNRVTFPSYVLAGETDEGFIEKMSASWSGALPTTFVYARDGLLIDMHVGQISFDTLDASIRLQLSKRP